MSKYPTAFDVENTITKFESWNEKGKKHIVKEMSPFSANNFLVSVGISQFRDGEWCKTGYFILDHKDLSQDERLRKAEKMARVQELLDQASILVGHNIKHDLKWAWAVGLKTPDTIWDTMTAEYILGRGDPKILYNLGLDACTQRYKTEQKKQGDLVEEYMADGIMFDAIPIDIITTYGMADCVSCGQLYHKQLEALRNPENASLVKSVTLLNYFTRELTHMEYEGIAIDQAKLQEVRSEYLLEQQQLSKRLYEIAESVMGDRPFSLASPDDMSVILFSRRPVDKKAWTAKFVSDSKPINRRMKAAAFGRLLSNECERQQRQDASHCSACGGTGKVTKIKKDLTPYAKAHKCKACDGEGVLFRNNGKTAGFKFMPKDAHWITANGFNADKEALEYLAGIARSKGHLLAEEFCQKKIRLNQVNIYLQTFCEGITRGIRDDGLLHANFNQARTKTTRLSSSDPNMQNQPRSNTFPVKKAFISRWTGGKMLDVDFSQLEFRVAVALAKCVVGRDMILSGEDVHELTFTTLTEAGQPTNRQEAKPRTFTPLFGGMFGTPAEMEYYRAFLIKYAGIAKWHEEIQDEAIRTKKIRTPTGKEYVFPYAKRNFHGGATGSTKIKNFPVQGTATGDIVPLGLVLVSTALRGYKSVICNTVHDSLLVDVHPEEVEIVPALCFGILNSMNMAVHKFYGWDHFDVPIAAEAQMGDNWMDQEKLDIAFCPQDDHINSVLDDMAEYMKVF